MILVSDAAVSTGDGEFAGRLAGVLVASSSNQIIGLLVRPGGLEGRLIQFPVQSVIGVTADEVRLGTAAESLWIVGKPDSDVAQPELDTFELRFGVTVMGLDGPAGSLQRTIYDQYTFEVLELVVTAKEPCTGETAFPMVWVREIRDNRVVVSATRDEIKGSRPSRDDR